MGWQESPLDWVRVGLFLFVREREGSRGYMKTRFEASLTQVSISAPGWC